MQLILVLSVKLFSPIFKQPNQVCQSVCCLVSFLVNRGRLSSQRMIYPVIQRYLCKSCQAPLQRKPRWSHILWAYLEWEHARYCLPELVLGQELHTISPTNKELSYNIPQSRQKPLLRMLHALFDVLFFTF